MSLVQMAERFLHKELKRINPLGKVGEFIVLQGSAFKQTPTLLEQKMALCFRFVSSRFAIVIGGNQQTTHGFIPHFFTLETVQLCVCTSPNAYSLFPGDE